MPDVTAEVGAYQGTPLSGSRGAESSKPTWRVDVTFLAVESFPDEAFDPLASRVRLVGAIEAGSTISSVATLTAGGRIAAPGPEDDVAELLRAQGGGRLTTVARLRRGVGPGTTGVFRVSDRRGLWLADGSFEPMRRIDLLVHCPPAEPDSGPPDPPRALRLALLLARLEPLGEDGGPSEPGDGGKVRAGDPGGGEASAVAGDDELREDREIVLLDPGREGDGTRRLFVLPSLFAPPQAGRGIGILVEWDHAEVEATAAGTDGHVAAGDEDGDGKATSEVPGTLRDHPVGASTVGGGSDTVRRALGALAFPDRRRAALLFLARESRRPLVEEIALAGREMVVARLAQRVMRDAGRLEAVDPSGLGWFLERHALLLLSDLSEEGLAGPAVEALLVVHTGEVARHPDLLRGLVARADGAQAFERRVIEENRILLEDSSPTSRSRALRWLSERGEGPGDAYDPLAPTTERRAALREARRAGATGEPAATAGDGS